MKTLKRLEMISRITHSRKDTAAEADELTEKTNAELYRSL
jgi:hypothetical protein